MFTWTDRELNEEQAEAVLEDGSVFLIACPGSGKTRTLTYKIAYELSRLNSDRKFVIAITYTHRAADEIQERIEDLGVDTSRLWIGTIHAFCLEWIIKPYGLYESALANGYRIIDQHERETLLEELCKPYAAQRISYFDCGYHFVPGGYQLECPDANKHGTLHVIQEQYFQRLSEKHLIDFELLLWYSYKLVERLPEISRLLSHMFAIVLVDEYQDTKQIQYSIIGSILMAGAGKTRLFMVGDPNQSIFGSLGGYPIAVADLRQITGIPIKERELSRNYRSSSRLIDYFGNFNVFNTTVTPAGVAANYPSRISYNTMVMRQDVIGEVARLVTYSIGTAGVPPSEICILAPQWPYLAAMTRGLSAMLPQYEFDGPGMVPFARDTENFWYKLARIALSEPSPHMYVRRLRWASETLSELSQVGFHLSGLSSKDLLRICNTIKINEINGLNFLREFFVEICKQLSIPFQNVPHLKEHYDAFFESSARRLQRLANDGVQGVEELQFFRKAFQNRSGITVSTIHGVKGGEFDVVIAFSLLEGMVPHFSDPNPKDSANKLLYVVGSRARKNLHLISESGRNRGRYGVYHATGCLTRIPYQYDLV
jgi:superfamily I DNA/RNA helicase